MMEVGKAAMRKREDGKVKRSGPQTRSNWTSGAMPRSKEPKKAPPFEPCTVGGVTGLRLPQFHTGNMTQGAVRRLLTAPRKRVPTYLHMLAHYHNGNPEHRFGIFDQRLVAFDAEIVKELEKAGAKFAAYKFYPYYM
jgi:hypothetical protein